MKPAPRRQPRLSLASVSPRILLRLVCVLAAFCLVAPTLQVALAASALDPRQKGQVDPNKSAGPPQVPAPPPPPPPPPPDAVSSPDIAAPVQKKSVKKHHSHKKTAKPPAPTPPPSNESI